MAEKAQFLLKLILKWS